MADADRRASEKAAERAWLGGQVQAYRRLRPRYERFARTLQRVLEVEARRFAPLAIVET
ncbi:MAG: hypothetical protein HY658_12655, partial [Actinobacteria bacterium]|nr:hypothetical protein [Actinomycetota bacterium]